MRKRNVKNRFMRETYWNEVCVLWPGSPAPFVRNLTTC